VPDQPVAGTKGESSHDAEGHDLITLIVGWDCLKYLQFAKTITEHLKHSAESSQAEIASVPVFWWAAFSGSAIVPN
jgi:hypothetical protein